MSNGKELNFDGRVAIITGAGQGLGRHYAMELAARGSRVVVNDVSPLKAQAVVDEIVSAGGQAVADVHDVASQAQSIVDSTLEAYRQLDIVVNNAGIMREGLFCEQPMEDFWRVFDVSFRGSVELTRAAWPHLVSSGSGRVVLVSSNGLLGAAGVTAYAAAKAAIWSFGNTLAMEGKRVGVHVSTIMPTAWTPMSAASWAGRPEVASVFRDKMAPDDVAAFVAFLAHQDTSVHGGLFQIAGGNAARLVLSRFPRVAVPDRTAEGWAGAASRLEGPSGELQPFFATADHLFDELAAIDPAVADSLRDIPAADLFT